MTQINFNAAQVEPDKGRGDPLPAGWYIVAMTKSEMKPTLSGTGAYLACEFSVLDGQHKGRKIFTNFNLRNDNQQAQEIAYKQFSAVCHAIGHLQVGDTTELHNKPLKVRVKIRPAEGQYEASNDITAYRNVNEATDPNPVQGTAAMPGAPMAPPPVGQGWAPPAQAPMAPPQQQWAPPAQAPAGPPPGWQPPAPAPQQWAPPAQAPAQPPAAPQGGQPAWQPPQGAQPQPWAQPQQQQAAPAPQAAAPAPGPAPASWQPPAAAPGVPTGGATPPWMQPPAQ